MVKIDEFLVLYYIFSEICLPQLKILSLCKDNLEMFPDRELVLNNDKVNTLGILF